jgi:hypothetical protein
MATRKPTTTTPKAKKVAKKRVAIRLSVYQRIRDAAMRGTGVRLSKAEALEMYPLVRVPAMSDDDGLFSANRPTPPAGDEVSTFQYSPPVERIIES